MDASHVHAHPARHGLVGHDAHDAIVRQQRAGRLDHVGVGAQHEDVVHAAGRQLGDRPVLLGGQAVALDQLDAQLSGLLDDPGGKGGGHVGQDHPGRMRALVKPGADLVGLPRQRGANDPGHAPLLERRAVAQLIGGNDAGPGLGQRALGVAGAGPDGEQIVAVVAVEDALVDDPVLGQAALDHVAIGIVDAVLVDVGLDDKALPGLILVAQVLADLDHGHADLMPQDHGIASHVLENAGVFLPLLDHLDVREAEPHRVVADQQLVRAGPGHGHLDRAALPAQVLEPRAVQGPEAVGGGQGRVGALVCGQFIAHCNAPFFRG